MNTEPSSRVILAQEHSHLTARRVVAGVLTGMIATVGGNMVADPAAADPIQDASTHSVEPSVTHAPVVGNKTMNAARLNLLDYKVHRSNKSQDSAKNGYFAWVGDSILAQYNNNPNSVLEGFDSVVDRALGMGTKEVADGGGGYVRPAKAHPNHITPQEMMREEGTPVINGDDDYCQQGTTVNELQRMEQPSVQRIVKNAAKLGLEGGINDRNKCDENGNLIPVTAAEEEANVEATFDIVDTLIDPENVYVTMPANNSEGGIVARNYSIIIKAAKEHGYHVAKTRNVLNPHNTIEGIHPNLKGVIAMAKATLLSTDLKHQLPPNFKFSSLKTIPKQHS